MRPRRRKLNRPSGRPFVLEDPAEAAKLLEGRLIRRFHSLGGANLDNRDQSIGRQAVLGHLAISRLEDMRGGLNAGTGRRPAREIAGICCQSLSSRESSSMEDSQGLRIDRVGKPRSVRTGSRNLINLDI